MGEVVHLPVLTTLDIPSDRIIKRADEIGFDEMVVLGFDKSGDFHALGTSADIGVTLYLLEMFKKKFI